MIILAIDIGGTVIKYGLVDDDNNITQFNEIDSDAKKGGEHIVDTVKNIVSQYKSICDKVSISTAGRVDSNTGIITFANENIPNYTGVCLKKIIEEEFDIPTYVENDVYCAAIAEKEYGVGKDANDFLCLTVGTGIGGAVVLNRELYKGTSLCAGDFGEMITGRSKFENLASVNALVFSVAKRTGKILTGKQIFSQEYINDKYVKIAVDEWLSELVKGIKTLIYIFDVPLVVLGGGIMNEESIVEFIQREINGVERENFKKVKVCSAHFKNKAGIIGAAHNAKKYL